MSEENVESTRRGIDAWNRRDLDALLERADPDIEYVNSPWAVEPGTRRGLDGYAAVMRAQWEVVGDAQLIIESMRDSGDDVFVMLEMSRTFGGGEARVEARTGMRVTYRGGRVVRQEVIPVDDFPQAFEAVGLRE
ncbi:MAG: nuclear transport factor 2 family protein [Actinomycetota bacterium]|nr:nuclear transport factor 2 family protein [Actinomycetota bacterium]